MMVFSSSFGCIGQNIYDSRTIYYNMDTLQCVDKDSRFWEGDELNIHAGNPDSSGLYCVFSKDIDVPFVTVTDDSIIRLLDSCLIHATKNDYLQFPDSSGYFIELHIFEPKEDSLRLGVVATPHPNYYMAEILSGFRNDLYYEWYGYREKDLQGCFFVNNILCVISSPGWMDYKKASWLFPQTESTITLKLFSPIICLVKDDPPQRGFYYYFNIGGDE